MKYTAVIRCLNNEDTIEKCILKLMKQTQPPNEIIVVDSGSKDNTIFLAKKNNAKIVKYPKDESYNYSKALNIGFEKATTNLILSISNHIYIDDIYLIEKMIEFLLEEKLAGISSGFHNIKLLKNKKTIKAKNKLHIINRNNYNGKLLMSNAFSIIRKKDWEDLNFNENILRAEDHDWGSYQIKINKKQLGFVLNTDVFYVNKYFSNKKWLLDEVYIARNFYPKAYSLKEFLKRYKHSFKHFFRGNFKYAYLNFIVPFYLLIDKILPFKINSGRI